MTLRLQRFGAAWLCASLLLTLVGCTSSSGGNGGSGGGDGGDDACDPGNLGSGFELTVTPGQGMITVAWDAVADATAYSIAITNSSGDCTSPAGVIVSTAAEDATSPYEHEYLIYGETYYYVVTASTPSGDVVSKKASGTPERLPLSEIEIPDENFAACVSGSTQEGGENEGAEFADQIDTLTTMGGLPETDPIGCWSDSAASVSGAEWLTSLVELNVSVNDLEDATPLQPLLLLQQLDLSHNLITDFAALGSLVNLVSLDLSSMNDGAFTNVDALHALVNAEDIDISENSAHLPCSDLNALIDALGADVVTPSTPDTDCGS